MEKRDMPVIVLSIIGIHFSDITPCLASTSIHKTLSPPILCTKPMSKMEGMNIEEFHEIAQNCDTKDLANLAGVNKGMNQLVQEEKGMHLHFELPKSPKVTDLIWLRKELEKYPNLEVLDLRNLVSPGNIKWILKYS